MFLFLHSDDCQLFFDEQTSSGSGLQERLLKESRKKPLIIKNVASHGTKCIRPDTTNNTGDDFLEEE